MEKDLLAIHESLLGRDVASCVAAWSAICEPDFDQASAHFLRGIAAGRGRVLVTMNGLVGDSGMGSPRNFLALPGPSHERLIRSERTYRAAFTGREVMRAVSHPCISDGAFCMTTFLGLDNRQLLPPFFPVQRNTDGVFGTTLASCFEHGYFGFLPWALTHAPLEPRAFSPEDFWGNAQATSTADVMRACILSLEFGPAASQPAERLRALGRHLAAIGSMARPDFEEFLRAQVWRRQSAYIAALEEHLRTHGESPDFWAKDVRRVLATLQECLPKADYIVPRDLVGGRKAGEARELIRRLVLSFGQLLAGWPDLVEGAKALRARGHRVAEPV